MKLELTENQLNLLKGRLKELKEEENELDLKSDLGIHVNGWDYVSIENEKEAIDVALKDKYVIV